MGTVKGDLHDIGKNLVGMMAEGAGFTIVDLGTDTSAENFIAAVQEHNARIIGMSALLTTTMVYMRTVVQKFKEAGLHHVKICIGGAPTSPDYAREIGADGYAADASSAVELFKRLLAESDAANSWSGEPPLHKIPMSRTSVSAGSVTIDDSCGSPAAVANTFRFCRILRHHSSDFLLKQGKCRECLLEIESGGEFLRHQRRRKAIWEESSGLPAEQTFKHRVKFVATH